LKKEDGSPLGQAYYLEMDGVTTTYYQTNKGAAAGAMGSLRSRQERRILPFIDNPENSTTDNQKPENLKTQQPDNWTTSFH
jgi:hypothetical protein